MKVKIGDDFYDSCSEPIMLILDEKEKMELRNLPEDHLIYCCYPSEISEDDIKEWMEDDDIIEEE